MKIRSSRNDFSMLLRKDLVVFLHRSFVELNPGKTLDLNWHLELMADKLVALMEGKSKKVIFTLPPRSLKSILASVAFPAFLHGHYPSTEMICVSYGQELADKHAYDYRKIITARWYQHAFPSTRLVRDRQAVSHSMTTLGGCRHSTSFGGALTGLGGDWIIMDDPSKPEEVLSDLQRGRVKGRVDDTLLSRLNDKKTGRMILVMQRLHEDDLVGHLLQQDGWEIISFPAIAEVDEEHLIQTPYGQLRHVRRAGEALHPSRESLETLHDIKKRIGPHIFASQYQQRPTPAGDGLIKPDLMPRFPLNQLPENPDEIIQSWDCANTVAERSAYSVCITLYRKRKLLYVAHVLRKRMEYAELKRQVIVQAELQRATVVVIEKAAAGIQLIQELKGMGVPIREATPTTNKADRMLAQTPRLESGTVLLPEQAPWLEDLIHEFIMFPLGRFDDQVDAFSQALKYVADVPPGWNLALFMEAELLLRQEAEAAAANPTLVLVRPPTGTAVPSQCYAFDEVSYTGAFANQDKSGNFLLPEYLADVMIRKGWITAPPLENTMAVVGRKPGAGLS